MPSLLLPVPDKGHILRAFPAALQEAHHQFLPSLESLKKQEMFTKQVVTEGFPRPLARSLVVLRRENQPSDVPLETSPSFHTAAFPGHNSSFCLIFLSDIQSAGLDA